EPRTFFAFAELLALCLQLALPGRLQSHQLVRLGDPLANQVPKFAAAIVGKRVSTSCRYANGSMPSRWQLPAAYRYSRIVHLHPRGGRVSLPRLIGITGTTHTIEKRETSLAGWAAGSRTTMSGAGSSTSISRSAPWPL